MTISQKVKNLQEFDSIMDNIDRTHDLSNVCFFFSNDYTKPKFYPCVVVITTFFHNEQNFMVVSMIYPHEYNSQNLL